MRSEHHDEDTGLRGVHVASTRISRIDAEKGELFYRGYRIEDLTAYSNFEEVAFLLIHGHIPLQPELAAFSGLLRKERTLPPELIQFLHTIPQKSPSISVLQSVMAALAGFCPDIDTTTEEVNRIIAGRILAKVPTVIATWERIRSGKEVISPDPDLPLAHNFLYMLADRRPQAEAARFFEMALILHAEHALNASTFTARVVASTRAHLYASISAAVGSLSGELHGGANERVIRNLLALGEPKQVEPWVTAQLDANQRIMGMGHAVYRTMDPRARILQNIAEKMAEGREEQQLYVTARRLVEVTQKEFRKRKGREIFPNVDLYSGVVYHMMGIPTDLFTPIFAAARTAGWEAHYLEERYPIPPVKPVIYRPLGHYAGAYCGEEGCAYIPIEQRT